MDTRKTLRNINVGYPTQIIDLLKEHQFFNILDIDKHDDSALDLAIKILLDRHDDLNSKRKKYETILVLAILKRTKQVINVLLTRKLVLNQSVAKYLIEAERRKFLEHRHQSEILDDEVQKVESESADFVEWILSKGVDLDYKNKKNHSALSMAFEYNLQHLLLVLLKCTKDINYIDKGHKTLLHLFIEVNSKKTCHGINKSWYGERYAGNIVKMLLSRGVSVDANDKKTCTAIRAAIEKNADIKIIEMLVTHTMNVNQKNSEGETLFKTVIKKWAAEPTESDYYLKVAHMLLAKGADVNEPDNDGHRPIFHVIEEHNFCIADFLQKIGADFNATTKHGETLLHLFISKMDDVKIKNETENKLFQLLLELTKNVNQKNIHGDTLFKTGIKKWTTSESDYYEKIALALIAKGADLNESDNYGKTPLFCAIEWHDLKIVEFLQKNGGDFSIIENNGETLMHLLASHQSQVQMKLLNILISNGCQLNVKDKTGNTPLHAAVNVGNVTMVQKFLELGVNVDSRNNKMQTPLIYLVGENMAVNSIEIAEMLLQHGADFNAEDINGLTALHAAKSTVEDIKKYSARYPRRTRCFVLKDAIKHNMLRFLSKHSIKLDVANLNNCILTKQHKCIRTDYYEKCLNEIETLKRSFIDDRTSLYALLHMNLNRSRFYVNSEELQKLLNPPTLEKKFPEYSVLIWASYREALTRRALLGAAKEAWIELTEIRLPEICIELILAFVTNSDLFNMIGKT